MNKIELKKLIKEVLSESDTIIPSEISNILTDLDVMDAYPTNDEKSLIILLSKETGLYKENLQKLINCKKFVNLGITSHGQLRLKFKNEE